LIANKLNEAILPVNFTNFRPVTASDTSKISNHQSAIDIPGFARRTAPETADC
jgi:hypothetical protein